MKNLPHLELTENPNKNNDFIIFRHSYKGSKINSVTKKHKKHSKKRKTRKGFFNIF
jgi:hypothetical protein